VGLAVAAGMLLAPVSTQSAGAAAPAISNVRLTAVGSTTATIAWSTDIASDTQVAYGLTTAYGSTSALNSTPTTSHTVTLTGLGANRTYHFQVRSKDATGDLTAHTDRTFSTALGATTAGSLTDSSNSNGIQVTRVTTSEGGKLQSLSANVGAVDASVARRSFQMGVYAANGSVPGALVASSATGTLVANSWNTVPISATLAPSTSYYLAYNTNGSSASVNNLRYVNGGSSGWRTGGQAFGTWPATFGAMSSQSATFSMHATFASDVTPPTVSLTSPTPGDVGGVVTLGATAADESGIASIQFKIDGDNLGAPDTQAPYTATWDTTGLLDGNRRLTAVATDTAGLSTTSAPVDVRTANPAAVRLLSPEPGSIVDGTSVAVRYRKVGAWLPGDGKHVHLTLDGGDTKMDFDADGDQSWTFTSVAAGQHTVVAVVADGSHVELGGSGGSVSFSSTAPDTVAPTVAVTSPAPDATVSGSVQVAAQAEDDNAVVGVQFLLDGNPLGSEDTTAPYAVPWDSTTVANGSHVLTARARDAVNATTSAAVTVAVSNSDPRASVGEWGPLTNWPLVAVHATLLKTGEVLMWDAWEIPTARAKLWNPTTNVFTDVPVGAGLFCAGQATDANGNLVVMGGHDGGQVGTKDVYSFDPDTRAWTRKPDMQYARWYPSVTQLPDGRMLTLSGMKTPYVFANTPEIFNPATNQVTTVPITTPEMHEEQYPQTAVLPNGEVLAISAEHGSVMTLDPATNTWTDRGTTQVPFGAWTSYAPGKFLVTGGSATLDSYDPSNPKPSLKQAKTLDMTSGTPVWRNVPDMATGRSFHNVTMLPTGDAMVLGGSTTVNDFSATGTLTAEQWSPSTNTWRQLASPSRPRMYHSISMLMPDGRILSAGGGRLAPAPDQLNMQMYSPGYLFKGPRPTITSLPGQATIGSTMDLVTPQAADIAKVSLVSLGSITHTADWNQRFVDLPFTRNGDTLTVQAPASANIAPANYYMVFAVDSSGVPSTAKIVQLRTSVPAGDATPPTVSLTAPTGGMAVSGATTLSADASDNVGVAGVQFEVDGAPVGAEDGTAPYSISWSSTSVANGTHTIRALARDAAGNSTSSAAVSVTVNNTAPTNGLVAAWSFNEASGSTVVDGSGNGNDGTLGGPVRTTAGKYGRALTFDGVNDSVTIPDAPRLDLGKAMTLEAWVRPSASSGWRTVLLKEAPGELAYSLYSASGTNRPSAWLDGTSSIGSTALALNTWSHLSATYDGARLKVYVNGVLRADRATTVNVPVTADPLKIGGNAVWGEYFAGQIDEVRIYSRALTATEITGDMNAPQS
jgi:hypothetical protein